MTTQRAASDRPSRTSLADSVYEILFERIVDGTIPAGGALNIDALARELDVSQTPIREALARLESTELVTRAALKGYRAAPLYTDRELADLMDARAVIEPVSAYLACSRSTSQLITALADSISELEQVTQSTSPTEVHQYWEADERFHNLIAEHSENRFLQSAHESLGGHVQRFRLFGALGANDAEFAVAEHKSILDAFEKSNPELARQRMADHVANVKRRAHADREALSE